MILNEKFIQAVIDIAQLAGGFIYAHYGKVDDKQIQIKDLNSLVSYVDTNSETIIIERLRELLPESSFLAEESSVEQPTSDYVWIIDPLDGTTNFLHQIPVFAVSIALQFRGEIILGVVYEVNQKECFHAVKGQGAYLNGNKIAIKNIEFKDGLIATGFPYYDFSKTDAYLKVLEKLMRSTRGVRRLGAAAVDLAYVACGRYSAFFEYSLAPWDVAAGALIVQEAGGVVSDFTRGENWLFGKTIVAGSPIGHLGVLNLIEECFDC
ncbi:MAG: inositol monophosphatase [Chitinophagales bacterium]|nr:inositol monophosphatase [Chitinophagales bacterium]